MRTLSETRLALRLYVSISVLVGFLWPVGFVAGVDEAYGPVIAREVVSGLNQPVYVTTPPDESRYLFVLEKGGSIRLFDRDANALLPGALLVISPITTASEQGLLGLAFHPEFAENRYFFVNYTNASGATVVRRYRMQSATPPYAVEPGSALDLLTVPQPYDNHNAGWLDFSPADGFLYISMGDGGSGHDPLNHGQNKETLLGSMLRIDVDGDDFPGDSTRNYAVPSNNPFVGMDGRDEIWAYGLRNPWRNSFDRETGDLWIADVGQSSREEVNFQAAGIPGGQNYGWRLREGTLATPTGGVGGNRPPGNVDPIYEYDFSDGRKSISGGYVYRGNAMPQLQGHYFFGDYVADFVRSFRYDGSGMVDEGDVHDWTAEFGSIANPVSFGEDADGELYIVSLSGRVYQITQPSWYLWRNRHFTADEIQDPDTSGPGASALGDGVANLVKYALGIGAKESGANLPIQLSIEAEGQGDAPYLTLTVERDPGADDVILLVESTGDLGGGSAWSEETIVVLEDEPGLLRVRDSVSISESDRRFIRLRAIGNFPE